MPPVTEDRRKELAKEAKALGEEGKVGDTVSLISRGVRPAWCTSSFGEDKAQVGRWYPEFDVLWCAAGFDAHSGGRDCCLVGSSFYSCRALVF